MVVSGRQALFPTKADVHGIKRQEVLREAAASFNFKGYHATSMTEIATSLGVTKAALYHYFPNKNSLLAACFEQAMDAAFASLERGRKEGNNGRDRLVLTISVYVSQLIDELNCCVVLMEEQALEPADRAKLVRQRDRFERALRALVREGIEDGSVVSCDPKLAIFVILGAMNWVPKWFKPSGAWKPEQLTLRSARSSSGHCRRCPPRRCRATSARSSLSDGPVRPNSRPASVC